MLPFPVSFMTPVLTSLFAYINKSTKISCLNILNNMIRIIGVYKYRYICDIKFNLIGKC
jgi:hypothetical protein